MQLNVGTKLLHRLMTGHDPVNEEDDDDDNNNTDDDVDERPADTGMDCLESQVLQSTKYDPVGISAKALATRFKNEFGDEGFPCLAHEIDWVKDRLPGRTPVAVPLRVINVLRRGGYFDTKRTSDEVWFSESRPAKEDSEKELVERAVKLLEDSGCTDVKKSHIVFFSGSGISDPVRLKGLVRFNRTMRQYHVNEHFLRMDLAQIKNGDGMSADDDDMPKARAFLLGFHVAQEHPDGNVLIRYLLRQHKN